MSIAGLALALSLVACGQLNRYSDPEGDVFVQPVAEIEDSEPTVPETGDDDDDDEGSGPSADADGDGVIRQNDCDDDDRAVHPGAEDTCGDDIDSDCDGIDCSDWDDGFEGSVFDGPWDPDRSDARWWISSDLAHDGNNSAESGNIQDNEQSELSLEVDTPSGGTVAFWHAGSTERTYDFLTFSVDREELGAWSGEWDFKRDIYALSAGRHTLLWSFTKDVSQSVGDDRVWIDDVKIEGGGP